MAEFGSWSPDLPDHMHDGLVTARNVYAGPNGYEPFRALSVFVDDATDGTWLGGGAFDESDGTIHLLAGSTTGLEAYASGVWSQVHTDNYTSRWNFVQFGDTVVGTADADMPPIAYSMSAGTAAALAGSPPNASMCAVVKDFLFLAGDAAAQSTVYWSGINDITEWTPGTAQSDFQLVPDGGPITGLAGGEYGLVFQESAISIFSYVGTPVIFERRKISDALGAITQGGIVQAGKLVFFLSNRGFYLYNDGELRAIGEHRVDRSFFAQYPVAQIKTSLRAAIEPNLNLVIWSMPGRLWIYNWGSDRWSEVTDSDITAITTGRTGYLTLDNIQSIYGGTDNVTLGTDDPIWSGGDPTLLVVKNDDKLYAFGGTELFEATLRTAKQEPYPGLDAHIWNARPVGHIASGVTVKLDCYDRISADARSYISTDLRPNGDFPLIARGRFIQPEITIAGNGHWEYLQGIDLEGTAGGRL